MKSKGYTNTDLFNLWVERGLASDLKLGHRIIHLVHRERGSVSIFKCIQTWGYFCHCAWDECVEMVLLKHLN